MNMEKVEGFGGFFFRADDPEGLAQWYLQHLGINPVPSSVEAEAWEQKAGPTVFAPFAKATDYFGDDEKQFMLNFRVSNLDKIVQQLKTAGIEVQPITEEAQIGRFARLQDPEGNPIELWEPAQAA